jgi:hypothetical protein
MEKQSLDRRVIGFGERFDNHHCRAVLALLIECRSKTQPRLKIVRLQLQRALEESLRMNKPSMLQQRVGCECQQRRVVG